MGISLTLINARETAIIILRQRMISPQPNIWLTQDQSVNLSLSIVVQQKKTRVLYLFNRGGPTKLENIFFQIQKLRFSAVFVDFQQNSLIFK